jgi:hypothetical protein
MSNIEDKEGLVQIHNAIPIGIFGNQLATRVKYRTMLAYCTEGRMNRRTKKRVKLAARVMRPVGISTSWEAYEVFVRELE